MSLSSPPPIAEGEVSAYRVPTEAPEADGTLEWNATTLVLVELKAGGVLGTGYTYADSATAHLIHDKLIPLISGADPTRIAELSSQMLASLRNLSQTGISAMAVSAVDNALWDLKAKLLHSSVANLLGAARPSIPVYASGGFTSSSIEQLRILAKQWREQRYAMVKIKIGRHPEHDLMRVRAMRDALGEDIQLFVDANGAYTRKQALYLAEAFATDGVTWFEEPVRSTDLDGLHLLRMRGPAGMNISAGEYGYDAVYFRRMLESQAVDILQADATRCRGISGFMQADALGHAFDVPLSSHCAPALHVAACCASRAACHLEYFHDHVLIEQMLFDGVPKVEAGVIAPRWDAPGFGLEFKTADARPFAL